MPPKRLIHLIKARPEAYWEWSTISSNASIYMEDIVGNPDLPWCWCWVSANPNVTMDFVLANPDKAWEWKLLAANPGITVHDVNNYAPKSRRYALWEPLSSNLNLQFSDVLANPDVMWNWHALTLHPNITRAQIEAHPHLPWDWLSLDRRDIAPPPSLSSTVTSMETVLENPGYLWNWPELAANPHISWKDVVAHPKFVSHELHWTWWIVICLQVTVEDVLAHPELDWHWFYVGQNTFGHTTPAKTRLQKAVERTQLIKRELLSR